MRLMQSKVGMFLRILRSIVLTMGIFKMFTHDYFFKPFARTAEWELSRANEDIWLGSDQEKALSNQAKALRKQQETIYLSSQVGDVPAEHKIQQLTEQVGVISSEANKKADLFYEERDEKIEKIDKQIKQENEVYARWFPFIYLAIFLICLLGALFIPIEWISFGFLGGLFMFVFFGFFDHMLEWWQMPRIGLYIGLLLLIMFVWLFFKQKHVCDACETLQHKSDGFRGTKLYRCLWYLLGYVIFAIVLFVMPVSFQNGSNLFEDMPDLQLAGQYGNLNAEKKAILNTGHITDEGKQRIIKLNEEMAELEPSMNHG